VRLVGGEIDRIRGAVDGRSVDEDRYVRRGAVERLSIEEDRNVSGNTIDLVRLCVRARTGNEQQERDRAGSNRGIEGGHHGRSVAWAMGRDGID
jgi:hypothetical protein